MEEVVTRRLSHSIENPNGGFGELPDLILADGGIKQIRAIKRAVNKYNIDIPVYGMVKNDKHQTRALVGEDRVEIKISEKLFNVITAFQDAVHDTAIEYHRKLREQAITQSELDAQQKEIQNQKNNNIRNRFIQKGRVKIFIIKILLGSIRLRNIQLPRQVARFSKSLRIKEVSPSTDSLSYWQNERKHIGKF